MTYKHIKHIDKEKDLIIPCRKGDLKELQNLISIENLDSKSLSPKIAEKGLRYDLTVPLARFVAMHRHEISFPFKRYQIQPVWRADRPQKGRYREFWQCDADVLGTDSLLCEADFIKIYQTVFSKLGLHDYEIRINHRKLLEAVFLPLIAMQPVMIDQM